MRRTQLLATITAALLTPMLTSCGDAPTKDDEGLRVLADGGIADIAFISRPKRTGVGDVFQYNSFSVDPKSANIMRMRTVSGGGEAEPITPFGTGEWPKADIMSMDVSFDGEEIVFSARLESDSTYNLYRIKIDGTNPEEAGKKGPALIHSGPYDSVYPVYLPNDRVFFTTNETSAPGVKQFRDEYERGVTAQAATIDKRGGDLKFGPRNLSHRVSPTLITTADGRGQILHTNWDHLTNVNEGNLMVMNPDMTGGAEFFGKEGSGVANSYLKARQVNGSQFLAIATSRDRTFQSGAIIKIDHGKNEASSTAEILTPDVPRDREPSYDKIGRYYDAFPVTDDGGNLTHVLTSWANGPVQTDVAAGGTNEEGIDYGEGAGPPDFGIYVLDPKTNTRLPIYNDEDMWDVLPLAIGKKRSVPTSPAGATADTPDGTALIGALDVRESSLGGAPDGGMYRVRVIEGFSAEEGIPMDFGLTESDGAILLGEAPVVHTGDYSFAAYVPEQRPIHLQTLDGFGMSMLNEDRWFSAAAGEQRFCGGCHEERGGSQIGDPGVTQAMGMGAANLALAYEERKLPDAATADYAAMIGKLVDPAAPEFADAPRVRGLPWDMSVQKVFDSAGCATSGCHDGSQSAANPCVSITNDMPAGEPPAEPVTWCFDLRGEKIDFEYGRMMGNYTRSHISVLLMAGMAGEPDVEVENLDPAHPYQSYMVPQAARDSILIKYVQPEQVFPVHDPAVLAFSAEMKANGQPYESAHPNENTPGFDAAQHRALTTEEKYMLILAADMGGQYYSLENAPGQDAYGN
ncbi:MAG: hypothetical protein U0168_26225 [Nannocystaceae bacterium]|jgi:hypothetical protein